MVIKEETEPFFKVFRIVILRRIIFGYIESIGGDGIYYNTKYIQSLDLLGITRFGSGVHHIIKSNVERLLVEYPSFVRKFDMEDMIDRMDYKTAMLLNQNGLFDCLNQDDLLRLLWKTCSSGWQDMFEMILAKKPYKRDIDKCYGSVDMESFVNPLYIASKKNDHVEMIKYLLEHPVYSRRLSCHVQSLFEQSAFNVQRYLFETHHATITIRVLQRACSSGQANLITFMLDNETISSQQAPNYRPCISLGYGKIVDSIDIWKRLLSHPLSYRPDQSILQTCLLTERNKHLSLETFKYLLDKLSFLVDERFLIDAIKLRPQLDWIKPVFDNLSTTPGKLTDPTNVLQVLMEYGNLELLKYFMSTTKYDNNINGTLPQDISLFLKSIPLGAHIPLDIITFMFESQLFDDQQVQPHDSTEGYHNSRYYVESECYLYEKGVFQHTLYSLDWIADRGHLGLAKIIVESKKCRFGRSVSLPDAMNLDPGHLDTLEYLYEKYPFSFNHSDISYVFVGKLISHGKDAFLEKMINSDQTSQVVKLHLLCQLRKQSLKYVSFSLPTLLTIPTTIHSTREWEYDCDWFGDGSTAMKSIFVCPSHNQCFRTPTTFKF
ncbi:hypothetical protein DFA_03517 [Cavenderia fasciculata]|uniref:Ankyrin repeat-containing protein n=1 Tax=Cavenderia fasciculata TaxID=261658 RepID=F4PHT5_CACFS|nr:uncharacterized protein DFA_03517 [Cavenderia fasciculata]EGG25269.1 hypothetical protein DFA_03517 [Cavenderia fasciculata]|eukprot:XP_004363120.1 hypothetical protein DFA_03517 [Cavenderia fasciculata]